MKLTIKFLFLFFVLFCSCLKKRTQNSVDNEFIKDSIIQKGKTNETNAPVFEINLDTIPKKWTMLTIVKHKKVVFQPCDAGIDQFEIKKNEMNMWEFLIHTRQEAMIYIIEGVLKNNNQIKFSLKDKFQPKIVVEYTILNYSSDQNTATWESYFEKQEFVNENGINDYKVYNEPCKDCFDDCPNE